MGVLDRFEQRLDRLVSGAFAKLTPTEVQPLEIAAALTTETTDRAVLVGPGRTVVPNRFLVELSSEDFERLTPHSDTLLSELAGVVREHIAEQRYLALGHVQVEFSLDPTLASGLFRVTAEVHDEAAADDHWSAAAVQQGPQVVIDGFVHALTSSRTVFGRGSDADIRVEDAGVSRRHCEVRLSVPPVLVDLGSTNGTWVKGERVREFQLAADTDFTIGNTVIQFRIR